MELNDMEFMAIVDAKARAPSGCAAIGIYENGDLGVAARQVDKQLGGLITRLQGSGDFAAKLGDSLMLPLPPGSTAASWSRRTRRFWPETISQGDTGQCTGAG